MKILFFTHYSALYGANRSLLNLLEGLKSHKVQSLVIIPEKGDLCKELQNRNIPYLILEFNWWCGVSRKIPGNIFQKRIFQLQDRRQKRKLRNFNLDQINVLKKKLRGFSPDFVHSNSTVFNFGYLFSRKYNIPHIWHFRETQEQYNLEWWYTLRYIKRNFQKSKIILGVSNFIKQVYECNYNVKDIKVLYNPIMSKGEFLDLDKKIMQKKYINSSDLIFGIVGVLHPKKGQEEAIRAFAIVQEKYPNTKLIIVGLGDQTRLKQIAKELGVNKAIEFWGHIEDPIRAFLNIDVSLMCSRMEGMGRVTLESMASGVPVIGYKEGGTIELIEENWNGMFYKNGFSELAEKMIFFIKNIEERNRMGENARNEFEKKYINEVYTEKFLHILSSYG